jgi:hypothetical protein
MKGIFQQKNMCELHITIYNHICKKVETQKKYAQIKMKR